MEKVLRAMVFFTLVERVVVEALVNERVME